MVAVPQCITGTKRDRNFFSSPANANEYIRNLYAFGYVGAEKLRLNEGLPAQGQPPTGPLSYWIERFLRELHDRGKTPSWKNARRILHYFGEHKGLGHRPINSITREDILSWQSTLKGSDKTKHNYQRYARWFFRWCVDEVDDSPIGRNPMAKVKRFQPEHTDPVLLTPEQFGACLRYAKEANKPQLLAWLCLGGFQGIRTEEIFRMSWDHIDWQNGYVHVLKSKRVRSWKPRHLKLRDGLRRHLEPFAQTGGEIIPANKSDIPGMESNVKQLRLHRWRKSMLGAAGIDIWPSNTLRHSFKSYDEALNGSHATTQHEMGHSSPNMTRYGYGTDMVAGIFVTEPLAQQWFAQ